MNISGVFWRVFQTIGGLKITRRVYWTGYSKPKEERMNLRYFRPEEVVNLDPDFVTRLDQARHIAGIPFRITSGYRSPEKNASVIGAVADSAHLKGLAVDLAVENSHQVSLIIDAAEAVGITRRGIYVDKDFKPVHIHLDVDADKPAQVIFIKQEGAKA